MKKFFRSKENCMMGGIFGGMGKMLDFDPNVLRVAAVFVAIFTAIVPMLVAYLIGWIIFPTDSQTPEPPPPPNQYER